LAHRTLTPCVAHRHACTHARQSLSPARSMTSSSACPPRRSCASNRRGSGGTSGTPARTGSVWSRAWHVVEEEQEKDNDDGDNEDDGDDDDDDDDDDDNDDDDDDDDGCGGGGDDDDDDDDNDERRTTTSAAAAPSRVHVCTAGTAAAEPPPAALTLCQTTGQRNRRGMKVLNECVTSSCQKQNSPLGASRRRASPVRPRRLQSAGPVGRAERLAVAAAVWQWRRA
jgi:hypothetical protein